MKTEQEIAKENVETLKRTKGYSPNLIFHKQTCQRWLEFLEKMRPLRCNYYTHIKLKIGDLKQSIKIYEDAKV